MIRILVDSYSGSKENPVPLGRVNENETRTLVFTESVKSIEETFGSGVWRILLKRIEDDVEHSVQSYKDDEGNLCYDVEKDEIYKCGYGLIQLEFFPTNSDKIYKSKIWQTITKKSLKKEFGTYLLKIKSSPDSIVKISSDNYSASRGADASGNLDAYLYTPGTYLVLNTSNGTFKTIDILDPDVVYTINVVDFEEGNADDSSQG